MIIKKMAQYISFIVKLPLIALNEITLDVYALSDKYRKMMYISSISTGINPYFVERICDTDVTITKIKRIYVWQLRKYINKQDAVLIDIHRLFVPLFDKGSGLIIPQSVDSFLDISKPLKEAIKLRNSEISKTRKYTFEISKDPDKLKFFYENMHIPHVKKRYNDSARIENFSNFEKFLEKGELLFVKLNGEYMSGLLAEINGDTYFLRRGGVLKESYLRNGALVAAYYFSILRAKEIGAKFADLDGSKPFLSDGVLRHKILWGAEICIDKAAKRVIYLNNILFNQPFIYTKNDSLEAIVFPGNDRLIKEYARSGLEFKMIIDTLKYNVPSA